MKNQTPNRCQLVTIIMVAAACCRLARAAWLETSRLDPLGADEEFLDYYTAKQELARLAQLYRAQWFAKIHPNGYTLDLERVVTAEGATPPGCSGWGYCMDHDANGPLIADAMTVGCRWPARWDRRHRCWIVTGAGWRMDNGEVVERFPF